jgi:2-oxoglutarate ferredoxin oxidoreductase subunit delta
VSDRFPKSHSERAQTRGTRAGPVLSLISRKRTGGDVTQGDVSVDSELCKGCELCVDACPKDCLALSEGLNARGYRFAARVTDGCTGCAACAIVCPDVAITVYRPARSPRAA